MNSSGTVRIVVLASLGTIAMAGCVRSESSRYERQLSSSMSSSRCVDPEVASAFGLDDQHDPIIAVVETRQ